MIRKHLTTILRKILHIRGGQSPSKNEQLKSCWFEYTLTADGLRKGHCCFHCNKRSDGLHYLMPVGNETETLYFCSATCENDFKQLLRQV